MSYADHIQQLREHAARTAQAADTLTGAWLDAPGGHDYAAGQAAHGALVIACEAARDLQQAVRRVNTASVN
jgi:hypothetical protein